ncbi:MAG: outer membrane lipid asymmetry maintenance protein MlaD [Legionellales bacterium]|nr:outer membrane lipid asymmetry maintenance protein MlaD [Legionellales bacterium]OUX67674.1 MAG: outer membrane lipid asymmetry maintenance protein MlaD [bacterium TMED178]|tara:strand:- start:2768 stop:3226 length:459 start_codon:yes stop_codon:yes gene_type:complete
MKYKLNLMVGFFVVFAAFCLFYIALNASSVEPIFKEHGYHITANFSDITGLNVRSPVRIAGVKVGVVEGIHLDQNDFSAKVSMLIEKQFNQIPKDSELSVATEGLLGAKYLDLSPGFGDGYLADGDRIEKTTSSLSLEKILGKVATSFTMEK